MGRHYLESEWQRLQEKLHHDEQRVRRIMHALPDAFEYDYGGTDADEAGRRRVRLTFRPSKTYDPPSRELAVLTGMEGTLLIDATARRLVRVAATLIRDVDFGCPADDGKRLKQRPHLTSIRLSPTWW